ncbi:hypothetical protein [Bacillus wiedmannii]|uniref:hypothetical protein n=1 Tax=Bacillus wiedmannii TaxID=1890302 RepID=UPI00086A84ED|nr:hypothetical protein [Bacillus wiedmannii]SCN42074.1 A0A023PH16 (Uncharacterized protein) [Bacillus wiedmannii]
MFLGKKNKKVSIFAMIFTMIFTFTSLDVFTNKAYAMQKPGHTFYKEEVKMVGSDPTNHDNEAALALGLALLVPELTAIKSLNKALSYLGIYLSAKSIIGESDEPQAFEVKKTIYKADEVQNNNYWGYYYITITNRNTGKTVSSKMFVIGKVAAFY